MKARPLTVDDDRHGTANAYNHYRCRCEPCKAAQAKKMKDAYERVMMDRCACGRLKRKVSAQCVACYMRDKEAAHGTESRYERCRCDLCREASNRARRERRRRARERETDLKGEQ